MDRAYLDTSALVKLVLPEQESGALVRHLRDVDLVSSALARTELRRAVARRDSERWAARAERLLSSISLVTVDDPQLDHAGLLRPAGLRCFDAIHVAAALSLAERITFLVTYDGRMATAARDLGFQVRQPGVDGRTGEG